ncbi:protein phosphatase 1 regulatory subunit 3C-B-like protein [Lates japonicus]|uniref:Protein phosphatase 1 regulatory subunit 3C-B-like protein n=1 Tax=Lates japonicus TaxID=270547 RepID=A0AAD3MKC7_LATJO|nr:protein phosphatase 1 regulatory subunit 3C-B-like protein [Lates japonicus]
MNCTRVLHAFGHSQPAVMPVDLAMCLSLKPRSCFRRDSTSVNKKRVVFADAKGLALTAVRLFIPEPSSPTPTLVMKPSPAKLQGQQSTSNNLQRYKLRLGFPQPTLDFKAFLARLREMRVQLESCNISEHSLSGKVCVSHVSAEKAVHLTPEHKPKGANRVLCVPQARSWSNATLGRQQRAELQVCRTLRSAASSEEFIKQSQSRVENSVFN